MELLYIMTLFLVGGGEKYFLFLWGGGFAKIIEKHCLKEEVDLVIKGRV